MKDAGDHAWRCSVGAMPQTWRTLRLMARTAWKSFRSATGTSTTSLP